MTIIGSSAGKRTLSSRAKLGGCFFFCFCVLVAAYSRAETKRARILGIEQVQILTSDVSAETEFFRKVGLLKRCPPEETQTRPIYYMPAECGWFLPKYTFSVWLSQIVSLWPMPTPPPANLIRKIIFATDDVPRLRRYLKAHGVTPSKAQKPDVSFTVVDPDGHSIEFVQRYPSSHLASDSSRVPPFFPLRLIHVGLIVGDEAAMEHFYKDILGFRPYWHGGMKDDKDDWVALQVPDGTDWVEFMLNIPAEASKHTLGVMNHIALGVPDIHAVQKQLLTNGMKLTAEPKIGRDGKWQLNLYDPDDTRVEFMEFAPVEKPCCSEFTGPHPKP